jgi:hypothetical protein
MSGTHTAITTTGGKAMSDQVREQASNTATTSESKLRETKADDLRSSWDEWFETFETRRLNFIYLDTTSDGNQSNFFRLESPDREDG